MGKAILILDKKPEFCSQCPLNHKKRSFWQGSYTICGKTGRRNDSINNLPFAPDWCPIKEMPEHTLPDRAYVDGWNDCLDKILGGED